MASSLQSNYITEINHTINPLYGIIPIVPANYEWASSTTITRHNWRWTNLVHAELNNAHQLEHPNTLRVQSNTP